MLAPAPAVEPSERTAYVERLVAEARSRKLHEDPYWHVLLHYRRGILGIHSLIDDPAFFNSPQGKHRPDLELEATLRAFFDPPAEEEGQHPRCRFIARFDWLAAELQLDRSFLQQPDCGIFDSVVDHLKPASVALVFPAAYVNSPASMFGHTLLVIDSEGRNRLLSRAISYAANPVGPVGPAFIFGSFFGLYRGSYTVEPYYDRVENYGHINHRDMWEYELNFDHDEVMRLLYHAWELQNIYSYYYFLDENCAYNLLFLLDAGRPALGLTRHYDPWVIPTETIMVAYRAKMVREVVYRPSKVSRIRDWANRLGPSEAVRSLDVARGIAAPGTLVVADHPTESALRLDLASEYVQYLYTAGALPTEQYKTRLLQLLRDRSRLGPSGVTDDDVPVPPAPETGHGANRITLGWGTREGEPFAALAYRPAYHDLTDPDEGYEIGAQIQFANLDLRYEYEDDKLLLQRLDLIDIISASPRDVMFAPTSWKANFGLAQRRLTEEDEDALVGRVGTGVGRTYRPQPDLLLFGFVDVAGEVGNVFDADYALGGGVSAGLSKRWGERHKTVINGSAMWFGGGDQFDTLAASLDQNLTVSSRHSLLLRLQTETHDAYRADEALALWKIFF